MSAEDTLPIAYPSPVFFPPDWGKVRDPFTGGLVFGADLLPFEPTHEELADSDPEEELE